MKRVMLMPLVGCCFGGFFGGVGKMIAACVLFPTVAQVSRVEDAGLASSIAIAPESGVADTDLASPLTAAQFSESGVEDVKIEYDDAYLFDIEMLIGKIGNIVDLNATNPTIKKLRELYTSGKISAEEHLNGWKHVLGYCDVWGHFFEKSCAPLNEEVFGEWFDKIMRVNEECSTDQLLMYKAGKKKLNLGAENMLSKFSERREIIQEGDKMRLKLSPCVEEECYYELSFMRKEVIQAAFRYSDAKGKYRDTRKEFLSKFGTPCKAEF